MTGVGPTPPARGDRAPGERTPLVLVVSVWFEVPEPAGFRARVSSTAPDGELATRATAADPRDVVGAVESWLADVVRSSVT